MCRELAASREMVVGGRPMMALICRRCLYMLRSEAIGLRLILHHLL